MFKPLVLAIGLLAPLSATAQEAREGCQGAHQASCADGHIWDPESRSCTKQIIG